MRPGVKGMGKGVSQPLESLGRFLVGASGGGDFTTISKDKEESASKAQWG